MERETLKSRLGFILLSAGCAIGIGNVWKFPYIAGQGGGGAFVLFYLIFLVILGLPIMTMEFAVGRASRKSPVREMCIRDRKDDEHKVHQTGLFTAAAGQFHAAADDILEHCQHGGHGCKSHEQKEQAAPQPTHGHIGKDVGQGDKDKAGAAGLVHMVGKTGREDDQTGGDGYKGIQHHNADRFAQQGMFLADIAAEDGHGADAKAQGEDCLLYTSRL